jgi:dihydrofolate synthase / folylpolyglutamate synthase
MNSWQVIWPQIDGRIRFGIKPGLERMHALLEKLGHPERAFRAVQVSGTNGKGATAFALAALLEALDGPAGLYISPHLLHPGERIRLGGRPLPDEVLAAAWRRLEPLLAIIEPSYFELLTALALAAFAEAGARWAVLECGLGGRFDATSALHPDLGLLTSIGADHLEILGPTLEDVARDKAAIAPPGGVLLHAPLPAELARAVRAVCLARGARAVELDPLAAAAFEPGTPGLLRGNLELRLPAAGLSWREAGGFALRAVEELGLAPQRPLSVALDGSAWPGRFELRRAEPPLLLDVAHNPPALARLAAEITAAWPGRRFVWIVAGMADKDLEGNLAALAPVLERVVPLELRPHRRAAPPERWAATARLAGLPAEDALDRDALALLRRLCEGAGVAEAPPRLRALASRPLLVGGGFLAVAAWSGDGELPPGL